MATNQTSNYQLNQWEATDKVLRTEFNADNAKIDAALNTLAGTTAKHETALSGLLNGRTYVTSYTGKGTYGQSNPVKVTLPAKPEMMIVTAGGHVMFYAGGSTARVWYSGGGGGYVNVSWSGNQLSWYGDGGDQQMNSSNQKFVLVAFYRTE